MNILAAQRAEYMDKQFVKIGYSARYESILVG